MKNLFCAKCQIETPHKGSIDQNGEFLFECSQCDRFIKLPADHPLEQFNEFFETHKAANQGQVSVEEQERKLAAFLNQEVPAPANTMAESQYNDTAEVSS